MKFRKTEIDFSQAKTNSRLVSDYLEGKESVEEFFAFPANGQGFSEAIENRKTISVNRSLLVEVLREQHADAAEEIKSGIEALLDDNTFTVTTGHQLNLFTGPLFFIYKILTAIKLARWLSEKFEGRKFVPVYWMASEDHDLEEINHAFVYGKKISWMPEGKGPAGRLGCEGIGRAIGELKAAVGNEPAVPELIELLQQAYDGRHSLAAATRKLVSALFGKYGLVTLDGDDRRLKNLFVPAMQEELQQQAAYHATIFSIGLLEKKGYEIQVRPRELNLFYLSENSRERIEKDGDKFRVLNSAVSWDEPDLLKELREHPERFSPNVVMRPLYQETVLPNIAYVGGPAEIAYWLEYRNLFSRFKTFFPVLVLRNSALLVDAPAEERMQRLEITEEKLFLPAEDLAREHILKKSGAVSLSEEAARIGEIFDMIRLKASAIDPTQGAAVEGEKKKLLNLMKSMEEKLMRLQKKKHDTELQQITRLKERLFPEGTMQERQENFIPWYIRYGPSFFDGLLETFEPLPGRFLLIRE